MTWLDNWSFYERIVQSRIDERHLQVKIFDASLINYGIDGVLYNFDESWGTGRP